MLLADRRDEGRDALGLLLRVNLVPWTGLDTADVDDRSPRLHHLGTAAQGIVEVEGRAAVIEGIRGAVHNRHHPGQRGERHWMFRGSVMVEWACTMYSTASSTESVTRKS